MATVINTHNLFNQLKKTGFKEEQAEAVINTINDIQEIRLENVATKSDLLEVKNELKSDIRLLHWGVALLIVVVGIPTLKTLFV